MINQTRSSRLKIAIQPKSYKLIPLPGGNLVKVSNQDYEHLSKISWYMDNEHYAGARVKPRSMHKYIYVVLMGKEAAYMVDHKNGDPLDNRRFNLRASNASQNAANQTRLTQNTSGYRGVSRVRSGRWVATIGYDMKHYYLGTFVNKEEAAYVYDQFALALFGEFARFNLIDK